MRDPKGALIQQLINDEIMAQRPRTQTEICDLAARVSTKVNGAPDGPFAMIDAAASLAHGLFGPAFERADYGQKTSWIDMCEQAFLNARVDAGGVAAQGKSQGKGKPRKGRAQ
jgi:hypothetical protein